MNTSDNNQFSPRPADEWYVYQESGQHTGPVTLDLLARGVFNGKVPRVAYAGFAGEGRWRPVMEIPEVAAAVRALEAAPPSGRAPLPPRVPSSMAPPAPPLGFTAPPRVAQISSSQADETIPAPSNPQTAVLDALVSSFSSSAPTARALTPSPIPPALPMPAMAPAAPTHMATLAMGGMPALPTNGTAQPLNFIPPPVPPLAPVTVPVLSPTMPTAAVTDQALVAAIAKPVEIALPAAKGMQEEKQEKKDEKKDVLDRRYRFLPLMIFGACVVVAVIEVAVGLMIH